MGRCICTSSARPPFLFESDNNDLKIPFSSFVLTNSGEIVETQMEILRERVRTIGISILGGKSGVEGPYELGIDNIRAVNPEDVTNSPGTHKLVLTVGISGDIDFCQVTEEDSSHGTQWNRGAL
jgi:NADH dehydrogenase [ubiquinone] 1 alpha subcomplex assembly factor 1